MIILKTVAELKTWRQTVDNVGFVPTMGALHAGHLTLVERAKQESSSVLVSIFVNPTQFNSPKDLENYPRTIDRDLRILEAAQIAAVFLPSSEEIYADHFQFRVEETHKSKVLCGPLRPGHFDGVLTVVLKLFNLVRPQKSFFGEKDYQQLQLIKEMARAFFLDNEVIGVPTVREADGLAMSSRNLLLTPEQREKAPLIYKIISTAKSSQQAREDLEAAGFRVDYVDDLWNRRFAAAFLGDVRLIDNVAL